MLAVLQHKWKCPKNDIKVLSRCLKIWLAFLYYSQSFADGWNHQCHMVPWQCCHISDFCAEQLRAPFDYKSKNCKFCLSQYLSLWGIFWFCFWAAFLLTSVRPFFGVWINGVKGGELQWLCLFPSCSWVAVTSQKLTPVCGSGVECDGWVPDVTETPDLVFAVFAVLSGSGALARKERVFPTPWQCAISTAA